MSLDSTPVPGPRQSSTPASTPKAKQAKAPKKPRPDFPLGIHKGTGYWCKKVRGRVHYFGRVADDPRGKAALDLWIDQKDALMAGKEPRDTTSELVVGDLCNLFLSHKETDRDNGELSPRTFLTYHGTCAEVVKAFGRNRVVSDLVPDDFRKLKARLAKTRGLVSLRNAIQRVRTLFKFAWDEGLIPTPPRYGQGFKRPAKDRIDSEREAQRAKHGAQMFEAADIRLILAALNGDAVTVGTIPGTDEPLKVKWKPNPALRAMVLLAANCAYGQTDLANLTKRAVNLETGWVDFGRGKTGVSRRIPLWPETITAIREWLPHRPKAKAPADADLLFLTRRGAKFLRINAKGHPIDGIGQEFNKVIEKLGLKRARIGMYAFRHGAETVAGETGDQVAVNAVMGHKDRSMAAHYRERIGEDRLRRVVEHVRAWIFAESGTGDVDDSTQSDFAYLANLRTEAQNPRRKPRPSGTQSTHGTHGTHGTQKSEHVPSPDGSRPTLRIVG